MRSTAFPFTTQDIILATTSEVGDQEWEKIKESAGLVITNALSNLHHQQPNSPIHKFHEASIGFPVQSNAMILDFLLQANYVSSLTGGKLSVFDPQPDDDAIEFNKVEMTITKFKEVQIKPTTILSEYVLEILDSHLQKQKIDKYMLSGPNSYIIRGKDKWEISFFHPTTDQEIDMVVGEGAINMVYPKFPGYNINYHTNSPFAHIPKQSMISGVIIEGRDLLHAKAAGTKIYEQQAEFQFKNFVKTWECGATLLMEDGSVQQFSA